MYKVLIPQLRGDRVAILSFERYEKKYLVSVGQSEGLIERFINERGMEYDKYCAGGKTYGIYNLYLDDDRNSVINASLMHPKFKEKLRIRGYSFPETGDETVFLELKRKIDGIVTKRRAVLPYKAAMDFVCKGIRPETSDYSAERMIDEIGYFLQHKKVYPKVFLSYDRIALTDRLDPSLRITFDQNILSRRFDVDLSKGGGGEPLLRPNERLMEIKFIHAPPKWLCDMLTQEKIFMTHFSKYGNEYSRYRGREFIHLDDRRVASPKGN